MTGQYRGSPGAGCIEVPCSQKVSSVPKRSALALPLTLRYVFRLGHDVALLDVGCSAKRTGISLYHMPKEAVVISKSRARSEEPRSCEQRCQEFRTLLARAHRSGSIINLPKK